MLHKVEEAWRINSLYDELQYEWDMHSADDVDMCLGDINGHVGRHIDGLDEVHRLVKGLQTDSKKIEGGRCMRGSDGKLPQ